MREIRPNHGRWFRVSHCLSAKLNVLLLTAMVAIFALLGYLNVRLHRQHLEQNTLLSAERISDAIKRGTTEYMLRDDQQGLHHSIQAIAAEPGMERIRIFDKEGRITYSTDPSEQNHVVDQDAEACYGCHAQSQPLARLKRPDRFRIYRNLAGTRVLGIITPIENQPACSNASCHAHPAEQQILGVLDTNMSLAKADVQLAETSRRMKIYTGCALFLIIALSWFFIWRVVDRPITALKRATEHIASGDLGYQIQVRSEDEIAELARSFNVMSSRLESEHNQNLSWTHTLQDRVAEKTCELTRAHEHALQTEKMASIGKMAAVLAHEINNPLSGILTYAKLLRKWTDREDIGDRRRAEIRDSLDLIASESRRCGDLVKNLLTFSRTAPMNLQATDLNRVIEQSLRLVQHQADLAGIHVQPQLESSLPLVRCDAAQIEQVLLALIMNAMDAMPQGGNLWIVSSSSHHHAQIVVRDDGSGIPAEILPRIFEPFLTTKETGRGVGLGLAISHSILERHNGTIEVQSEVGHGTTFVVTLPADAETKKIDAPPAAEIAASGGGR